VWGTRGVPLLDRDPRYVCEKERAIHRGKEGKQNGGKGTNEHHGQRTVNLGGNARGTGIGWGVEMWEMQGLKHTLHV
jgi:hypothetical protein